MHEFLQIITIGFTVDDKCRKIPVPPVMSCNGVSDKLSYWEISRKFLINYWWYLMHFYTVYWMAQYSTDNYDLLSSQY